MNGVELSNGLSLGCAADTLLSHCGTVANVRLGTSGFSGLCVSHLAVMQTLILDEQDLRQLVRQVGIDCLMDELTERLRRAFVDHDSQQTEIPPRDGFHYEMPTGLIEWMPLHQQGRCVLMKMVGYHPASPRQCGLPTIVSTMSTYDTTNGHLMAVVDGTFLTAMRTGAASGIASELLARPGSRILGLVGCGAQAVTQLHAIGRRFPIEEVLCFDINSAVAESLAQRAAAFHGGCSTIRMASLQEIAADADIICTATSVEAGAGPVIDLVNSQCHVHVNAVGADFPGKTELPIDFLQRSLVCPDFLSQAQQEGECQQLSADQAGPTIAEIARTPDKFASARDQTTVFDSTGWALEDWVAMELVIEKAGLLKIGSMVSIECLSRDPLNPYDFLREFSGEKQTGRPVTSLGLANGRR